RKRQMNFFADPVTDQNEVYEAYLCFANDSRLFRVTADPPPECAAHICRKKGCRYYWVPLDSGQAFLSLVLLTSFGYGKSKDIESYYDRTIVTVEKVKTLDNEGFSAEITFAKGKETPNGDGTMVVPLENGRRAVVRLFKVAAVEGTPTDRL